ncbi:hypothetical protein [Psychroserpens sp.]|uniref:hypothetical protein n=1 Tax=Psychroserpens sp. TaxID=2020870 RepID=UPI002B26C073|nr:hypothetical protein [Psychroserpens sp.]
MNPLKKIINFVVIVLICQACNNASDGDPENGSGIGNQDEPNGVGLVFPAQDALCNEGTDLTPTESTVYFEWESNTNAQIYTLTLEHLETNTITQYTTEDYVIPVTIQRAAAFRWFVEYVHDNDIKKSAIWNFYNAGPGVQNYAPFPAEIVSPAMAQSVPATNSVTLEWSGSDVDNDIIAYDVYFGTDSSPDVLESGLISNQTTVPVLSGTIYYWNVITIDSAGNSSESGVHQFIVL